eukprot:COSAG06_NODE_371_length_16707_cov_57.805576_27_plen_84_part_00
MCPFLSRAQRLFAVEVSDLHHIRVGPAAGKRERFLAVIPLNRAVNLADDRAEAGLDVTARPVPEKTASFLSFPYVCPEPVLVK